jgi:hypothetical protein
MPAEVRVFADLFLLASGANSAPRLRWLGEIVDRHGRSWRR